MEVMLQVDEFWRIAPANHTVNQLFLKMDNHSSCFILRFDWPSIPVIDKNCPLVNNRVYRTGNLIVTVYRNR